MFTQLELCDAYLEGDDDARPLLDDLATETGCDVWDYLGSHYADEESSARRVIALCQHLDCHPSEVSGNSSDLYGEGFDAEGGEWVVCTDDEADTAVTENIEQSLCYFRPEFLASQTDLPVEAFQGLAQMHEEANEPIRRLIEKSCEGFSAFVEAAVSADGRGHFLNPYDGAEHESNVAGEIYYIYRTN